MLIHLNTTDVDVVTRVYQIIQDQAPDSNIHTDPSFVQEYVPGSGEHLLTFGRIEAPEDPATFRWAHLRLASLGGRYWTETKDELAATPYLAGSLDTIADLKQVVTDASYAESRSAFYRSFGVFYLGRVFEDPRTIVVLDNKKDKSFHPQLHENVSHILSSLPESTQRKGESSWGAVALVTSGNVAKLGEFLDYLSETNVVAYSEGAMAKLRFLERDFAQIEAPTDDPKFGAKLLDEASRLKPAITA